MQNKKFLNSFIFFLIITLLFSCSGKSNETVKNTDVGAYCIRPNDANNEGICNTPLRNNNTVKKYTVEIIDVLPHDTTFYTQGLVIHKGKLYEGTGLEGKSILAKFDLKNWKMEKNIPLKNNYFGEGITVFDNKIFQLTWMNQICLVYDLQTLEQIDEFRYLGEGWGLTNNDSILFMSDGSSTVKLINPKNFKTISNINITRNNVPVRFINELELVDSLLYANIYMRDLIIIANINTGKVVGEIDISSLRPLVKESKFAEVSNGIAYCKERELFYLTGKFWNKIFIVKFVEL